MKALTILLVSGCMFTVSYVSAQQPQGKMLPVVTITSTGTNVSEDVRKAFVNSFGNAENARWYEANKNFLVKFIKDDQEHNVLYRKNGSLIYHITFGFEKNLPMTVQRQIKSRYPEFTIARVFNINQDSRKIWVVNLENDEHMVITRVEGRELNEVSRMRNLTAKATASRVKQQ
jgi:hypothetical protein